MKNNIYILFSVLPKFEVKVQVADEISYGDEEIKVDVCAK